MAQFPKMMPCATAALMLLLAVGSQSRAQDCDAPNPATPTAPPSATISPNAAAFSGVWGGTWVMQGIRRTRASMCARLHVSVTSNTSADVAYCYGTRSDTGNGRQCDKYAATINGNVLQFKSQIGGNFTFTNQGGSLSGETHSDAGQYSTQAQFHKM